jgi:hypothetical protein
MKYFSVNFNGIGITNTLTKYRWLGNLYWFPFQSSPLLTPVSHKYWFDFYLYIIAFLNISYKYLHGMEPFAYSFLHCPYLKFSSFHKQALLSLLHTFGQFLKYWNDCSTVTSEGENLLFSSSQLEENSVGCILNILQLHINTPWKFIFKVVKSMLITLTFFTTEFM